MTDQKWFFKAEKVGLKYIPEPKLSREQNYILKWLISKIVTEITDKINFDHLNSSVKRYPIPLKANGKRYDISLLYGNRIVLISVDTLKPDKPYLKKVHVNG